MPVTKSAIRTLRSQERKRVINLRVLKSLKSAIRVMRQTPNAENLQLAYSQIDLAAKKGVIHSNKGDRLKSRLSSLLVQKTNG